MLLILEVNPKTFQKVYIVECKMKELQYRSYLTVNDKEDHLEMLIY